MSARLRPTSKNRPGGTDRRRRHRHSDGEARSAPTVDGTDVQDGELDIEDYLYGEWGAFLADEAGARAGC